MGVEVITLEKICVYNHTKKVEAFIQELQRHYGAIDYNRISCLEITLDGQQYQLDTTLEAAVKGVQKKDAQNPFYQLLAKADKGKKLTIKIGYDGYDEKYGYAYWQDVLSENLKPYVTCKCLEYYDQDDEIITYVFDDKHSDVIPWGNKKEDVSDVNVWYSYNFSITIEYDGEDSIAEGKIGEYFASFIEKLEEFDENIDSYLGDDVLEVYGGISISSTQLDGFIKLIDEFYKFCLESNLECELTAPFLADDSDSKFATFKIAAADNGVAVHYCRF